MSNTEFCEEILALASSLSLTPIPVRGRSQCAFEVVVGRAPMTLWVGFYPGFCKVKGVKWQVAISTDAKAVRWGVTEEGVKTFLSTSLIENGHPVARKGGDLKALRKG